MNAKLFSIQYNIGRSKYVVNHFNGTKTHADGSPFFDIKIFRNKKDLSAFTASLVGNGYIQQ